MKIIEIIIFFKVTYSPGQVEEWLVDESTCTRKTEQGIILRFQYINKLILNMPKIRQSNCFSIPTTMHACSL